MEIKFANNASSRLALAIAADATKLTVLPSMGVVFPRLDADTDFFLATITDTSGVMEIVKVTHIDGDDLTIVRAQEGTIAHAFPQNAVVENRLTAASIDLILNDVAATETQEGRVRFATREEAVENIVTDAAVTPAGLLDYQLMPGIIVPFSGQFEGVFPINALTGKIDPYWHICDGTGGTPDLRDKFILGFSADHANGTSGGTHDMKDLITFKVLDTALTTEQMPPHTHKYKLSTVFIDLGGGGWDGWAYGPSPELGGSTSEYATTSTGAGEKHTHEVETKYVDNYYPPYYATAWIMRLAR